MKITSAHVVRSEFRLKTRRFLRFRPVQTLETALFTLESESGVGRSEASAGALPEADMPHLAEVLEREIAPRLAGRSIANTEQLREALGPFARNRTLYALAEMAWWNLLAAEKGTTLCAVLGAEPVSQQVFTALDEPPTDASGYPLADPFFDRAQSLYAAGYVHLELKIRPGWDLAMVRIFRQENTTASFHLDPEGTMTQQQLDTLFQFRDFFPRMIEQPFDVDCFTEHADFQSMVRFPLCLDESVTSPELLTAAIRWQCAGCFKVNPVRVGGFETTREMAALCAESGRECWIAAPLQTGVGARNAFAAACFDGVTGPFEYYDLPECLEDVAGVDLPPALTLDEAGTLRIGEQESDAQDAAENG